MKYFLAIVVGVLSLLTVAPAFADAGVAVTLTTTVTGGGSSGGGSFGSGDSLPNSTPDWTKIFPSMTQSSSPSTSTFIPPSQQPVIVPPVMDTSHNNYVAPSPTPVSNEDKDSDIKILAFIGLGAIILAIILYLVIPEQEVR